MSKIKLGAIAAAVLALIVIPTVQYHRAKNVRYLPRETWKDAGQATPEAALETYFWAAREGNLTRFAQVSTSPETPLLPSAEAEGKLRETFEKIKLVRIRPFRYAGREEGFFTADWIREDGTQKPTRSKWRRVGLDWKLVNDEPATPAARK